MLISTAGCAGVSARETRLRNAIVERRERHEVARGLSEETSRVLERHGLLAGAFDDPGTTALALEARIRARPEPDAVLVLSELSYRAGLERQSRSALEALAWYRDAATLAALALSEPEGKRPELAIELHNLAVARLIRTSQAEGIRDREAWRRVLGQEGLALGSSSSFLDPERIADLTVASDLRVKGMDHLYGSGGLGVPVVARRLADPTRTRDPRVQLMPREVRVGGTAVLLPGGGFVGGEWRRKPSTLILFDPFRERTLTLRGREVELASDRTTALAVQVSRGHLETLEWAGLLDSSFSREGAEAGIYMMRPYEPGKIPVVLVHGLVSSPRAFVQTINELGNDPVLASRFQFWVFIYPTGQPIPASAAQLRASLRHARETLDPVHADAALEQMVLVGHSMGGLLSKMMAQDSGLDLWNATIRVPYERILNSPVLKASVGEALVFQPVPYVSRLVFIASPHRGSPIADDLIGRIVASLVRRPDNEAAIAAELKARYGANVISPELRGRAVNAISNLRTDSPILAVLDRIPIVSGVPYHSIIPQIDGVAPTDGVVEYRSSHLEGAASERIVDGTHFSQQKPEVTRELRRILHEHLAAVSPPPALARK